MSLKQHTQAIFRQQFNQEPDITIKAPGRVNLIGEHTDYNDGFVLPCAIDYETVISCGKRDDRQIRVIAADYENQQDIFSLDAPIVPHAEYRWADYVRGVVKHLQLRHADFGGADLVISGNVPQGAGLSSSASLEVAVGQALQSLCQLPLSGVDLALKLLERFSTIFRMILAKRLDLILMLICIFLVIFRLCQNSDVGLLVNICWLTNANAITLISVLCL